MKKDSLLKNNLCGSTRPALRRFTRAGYGEGNRRGFCIRGFFTAFGLIAAASLSFPGTTPAHEPITTRVRFNKEVIRVLQRNCLGCHHSGGIAMSLATYDEARPWAKAIKTELLERRMPPWNAVKGFGEFRNAPLLSQRDIDLIINWVEGGAPKGEDKELPDGPLFSTGWSLGKPDLVLSLNETVKVRPDYDEYRTFTVDSALSEDRWLKAVDLRPGNASVVHCATISVRPRQAGDLPWRTIATWLPGQPPVALDPPAVQALPAGSQLSVRVHYRGAGEAVTDQSELGLYFSGAQTRKPLQELVASDPSAVIPAGAARHRVAASIVTQSDLEAIAVRPRAHPLIVSMQATAYRPDGSQEVLIWTRGYQFDWQQTYYFKRPVALPKGTRVEVIAYFDNSDENRNQPNDPPKQLRWSDLTTDPMFVVLAVKGEAHD